jgi:hypothetical protein
MAFTSSRRSQPANDSLSLQQVQLMATTIRAVKAGTIASARHTAPPT